MFALFIIVIAATNLLELACRKLLVCAVVGGVAATYRDTVHKAKNEELCALIRNRHDTCS